MAVRHTPYSMQHATFSRHTRNRRKWVNYDGNIACNMQRLGGERSRESFEVDEHVWQHELGLRLKLVDVSILPSALHSQASRGTPKGFRMALTLMRL